MRVNKIFFIIFFIVAIGCKKHILPSEKHGTDTIEIQKNKVNLGDSLVKAIDINTSQTKKTANTSEKNDKICRLPFYFKDFYITCYENIKECEKRYPSYNYPENKNILNIFGINEAPSKFFLLSKQSDFQPVVLAFNRI